MYLLTIEVSQEKSRDILRHLSLNSTSILQNFEIAYPIFSSPPLLTIILFELEMCRIVVYLVKNTPLLSCPLQLEWLYDPIFGQ